MCKCSCGRGYPWRKSTFHRHSETASNILTFIFWNKLWNSTSSRGLSVRKYPQPVIDKEWKLDMGWGKINVPDPRRNLRILTYYSQINFNRHVGRRPITWLKKRRSDAVQELCEFTGEKVALMQWNSGLAIWAINPLKMSFWKWPFVGLRINLC